jgi:ATP-dependent helicase/nuclease subunit A
MSRFEWDPGQKAAIEIEGRDLLVTAGAGTGKTSVLVERVLRKLRSGAVRELDALLVVTFTDKAAQEMKARIYQALLAEPELRRFLPQLPRAAISTIHAFCSRLLREHFLLVGVDPGFGMLDENGQKEALDESLRRTFHDWYTHTDGKLRGRFESLVELAGFDEDGEGLRKIVRRLHEYARTTPDPIAYLEGLVQRPPARTVADLPWYPELLSWIEEEWNTGVALYQEAVRLAEAAGKNTAKHARLAEALGSLHPAQLGDPEARSAALEALVASGHCTLDGGFQLSFPRAPSGANAIPGFKDLHDQAKKILNGPGIRRMSADPESLLEEDRALRENLSILVQLVRQMDGYYAQYKIRNGLLDFSDLEIETVRLLEGHGEALQIRDRFAEILVDEYQDINPLQERILEGLSREGRRFRVGDVKQSIYQFRLADPKLFLEKARASRPVRDPGVIPAGDDPLAVFLRRNFRSRPGLLRVVNHLFGQVFRASEIGSSYAEQALLPGVDRVDAVETPVELHLIEARRRTSPTSDPATDPRRRAPGDGSDEVASVPPLSEHERLLLDLREDAEGELHPLAQSEVEARLVALRLKRLASAIEWKDVALLLRTGTHAGTYLEALQAQGIPAYLAHGGSLLEEPAVRDFHNLLKVIDNPRDDVAFAAVLRSPLAGLLDSELLRIRLAYPTARSFLDATVGAAYGDEASAAAGWFLPPDPKGSGSPTRHWIGSARDDGGPGSLLSGRLRERVRAHLEKIGAWRLREQTSELVRFLVQVVEETSLLSLLTGAGDGTRQRACLEKLLELARSYEAERGPSLRGFLARLDTLERTGGIESVPANAGGGDAVQILTIHKAKGLEFPVVVLPQLEWRFFQPRDLGGKIRIGPEWVGLRRLDFHVWGRRDTLARQVLEWRQQREARDEEARVLYVACTRAKERLILVGVTRKRPWEEEEGDPLIREIGIRRAASALDWLLGGLPWQEAKVESTPPDLLYADAEGGESSAGRSGPVGPEKGEIAEGSPGEDDAEPLTHLRFPDLPMVISLVPASFIEKRASVPGEMEPPDDTELYRRMLERLERIPGKTTGESGAAAAEIDRLLDRVSTPAPAPPIASLDALRGKYWVTELKRIGDAERLRFLEEESSSFWLPDRDRGVAGPGTGGPARKELDDSAGSGEEARGAERGIRYHMALARLDLTAVDPGSLARQLDGFERQEWWGVGPRDSTIEAGIAGFFGGPLGARLSAAAGSGAVEREVPFSLKWPVGKLLRYLPVLGESRDPRWDAAAWNAALDRAWVLLQGRIDCLFRENGGWVLIDWKTDRIGAGQLEDRTELYRSQMRLYAEAVSLLWGSPVETYLCFLALGKSVPIEVGASESPGL